MKTGLKQFIAECDLAARAAVALFCVFALGAAAFAVPTPLGPSPKAPFDVQVDSPHQLRIFDDGLEDLAWRVAMIKRAQVQVDYMTYTFRYDTAGQSILRALLDRALHGVQVRLLLDWYSVHEASSVSEVHIAAIHEILRRAGVSADRFQVRFYNRLALNPLRYEHRNHAKLLIVDQRELLMGGRNTGEMSFGVAEHGLNFLDRDVWIKGPMISPRSSSSENLVAQTDAAFSQYWNDVQWVSQADDVAQDAQADESQILRELETSDLKRDADLENRSRHTEAIKAMTVRKLRFVIDRPGHERSDRVVTPMVDSYLNAADESVLIENDSFSLSPQRLALFANLMNTKSVAVTVITNGFGNERSVAITRYSLESSLALMSEAPSLHVFHIVGFRSDEQEPLTSWAPDVHFFDHTKSMVIGSHGSKITLIGSYNFDARSECINNESMLVIEDANIAQLVTNQIQNRMDVTRELTLGANGQPMYRDGQVVEVPKRSWIQSLTKSIGLDGLIQSHY